MATARGTASLPHSTHRHGPGPPVLVLVLGFVMVLTPESPGSQEAARNAPHLSCPLPLYPVVLWLSASLILDLHPGWVPVEVPGPLGQPWGGHSAQSQLSPWLGHPVPRPMVPRPQHPRGFEVAVEVAEPDPAGMLPAPGWLTINPQGSPAHGAALLLAPLLPAWVSNAEPHLTRCLGAHPQSSAHEEP